MRSHWAFKPFIDERGIALPMALIFVALLTTLMLSFAVLSQTEAVIGSNHMLATQARTQAESGFERAVWALSQGVLNPGATGSLASPLPSPVPGPYDGATFVQSGATGGFLVAIENVSNLERRVRSQGCVPNCTAGDRRGHRLIEAIVERFPDLDLDAPCALCVRGQVSVGGNALVTALTDTSCGNKKGAVAADAINISGSADIFGADGNTTSNQGTDLAANQTDPTTFDGVTLTPKHFQKLREISKLNGTYFGPGYPNGTPATSPASEVHVPSRTQAASVKTAPNQTTDRAPLRSAILPASGAAKTPTAPTMPNRPAESAPRLKRGVAR